MTLRLFFAKTPVWSALTIARVWLLAIVTGAALTGAAQSKPAPKTDPDLLVLSNGDTLHGKFVSSIQGKLTFHCDPLGDVSLSWDKVKELHTTQKLAVLENNQKPRGRKSGGAIPTGTVDMESQAVTVQPETGGALAPIPLKNALFIMDAATLDKELRHEPSFLSGWAGAATAGATIVTATQNQYTVSGAIGLVRAIPTVSWLDPRNRTSVDFGGSFGKITEPAYTIPAVPPATTPTFVAAVTTKSAIYHADAERDEYVSPRVFALGQTAFDHNFSQDLDLQQVYGGGFGWTVLKTPKQEGDLKGTIQYEKQQFITGSTSTEQDLIGSTFAATYILHTRMLTYTQGVAFIPAYNNERAYSATETDTFAFPTYKNLSFSLGTNDSYLNDPPTSLPPTKRNSFQFTMGLTYAIKPKD
ncbi:MAG: DUF481 domain-containing protein [Terracidiphilus sp.]